MPHHPKKPKQPRRRLLSLENLAHGKSIYLLCAMLVLFAVVPIVPPNAIGRTVLRVVLIAVLLSAGISVFGGRKQLFWLVGLGAVYLGIQASGGWVGTKLAQGLTDLFGATFLGLVVFRGLGRFFRARQVSADTIASALTTYLLIGVLWLYFYQMGYALVGADGWSAPLVRASDPLKDPTIGLFYFSFTTLTTLGYGDISPVHPGMRSLAVVEAVIGQFFVGVVIARLIGMQLAGGRADADD